MMFKESKFTKPRKDCENPELWSAPNGQATEVEVSNLIQAVVKALKPQNVLEAGTHEAHTSFLIATSLKENGRGKLITLEIDKDKALKASVKLRGLPAKVINIDCLKYEPKEKIDFMFVDGLPTQHRIKEWLHFKPHLNQNAIVMFHDTGPHRVFRGELEKDKDLKIIHLPTPRGVSIGCINN